MKIDLLRKLLESDALRLYAQPKWTFGQNTCNTYEVFADKIRMADGELTSCRDIIDEIESDPDLTLLFSEWFLRKAVTVCLRKIGRERHALPEPAAAFREPAGFRGEGAQPARRGRADALQASL